MFLFLWFLGIAFVFPEELEDKSGGKRCEVLQNVDHETQQTGQKDVNNIN